MKSRTVGQQIVLRGSYTVPCFVARREASSLVPIFAAVKELTVCRPSQRRQNLSGTNGLVADSLFAAVTEE